MPKVPVLDMKGSKVGELELSENTFGAEIRPDIMHEMVRVQLANRRQGTQSAQTRAEVRGGGKKPWRQKGTGRARHGSSRSPQWTHGGVAFAPKPRDYTMSINRRVKRMAMKSALSSKVVDEQLMVLDNLDISEAKTKEMAKVFNDLKVAKKAVLVLPCKDASLAGQEKVERATRNLPGVKMLYPNTLNVYDILNCDHFIILKDAVAQVEEVYC